MVCVPECGSALVNRNFFLPVYCRAARGARETPVLVRLPQELCGVWDIGIWRVAGWKVSGLGGRGGTVEAMTPRPSSEGTRR
jgi:hypothetical protein